MYNPGNGFSYFLHELQQLGARLIGCVGHLYQSQTNGNGIFKYLA